MKARPISGKSTEEIKTILEESVAAGYASTAATLSIVISGMH